ncbi:MAG: PP2C family protein-serine/threonine phosphatase [Jatrophihabitantaceae bacterium]
MTIQQTAADEQARLSAVRRYDVLDTPPDGAFERITALAARLLDVPISIVSIVDADRIWFKSHHGMDAEQIPRLPGLCASAILGGQPWVVTDAAVDPRTLANPLVAGEFGLRFYAGVPLTTHDGHNLGTLCVIDHEPRPISEPDLATLRDLAALVMDELELRLSARRVVGLEAERRHNAEEVAGTLQRGLLPPELPHVRGLDIAARYHVADRERVGGDFYDVVPSEYGLAVVVGDVCGKGTRAAALTGTARWAVRTLTLGPWSPAAALHTVNQVLIAATESPERYCTVALAAVRAHHGGGATFTVALGGHPHPLLVRTDGSVEALGRTAPIVGCFAEATYVEVTATLRPGDFVVLYTDGMLEALVGHSVDDSPLADLFARGAGQNATEVADRIDAALRAGAHLGQAAREDEPLRDDAAFVVLRAA